MERPVNQPREHLLVENSTEPPASQLVSLQGAVSSILPSSPPREGSSEHRLNASSILQALWPDLLTGQCSTVEALVKGECAGCKYEKIGGLD